MTMPALGRRGAETIRPAPLRPIVSLIGVAHRPWRLRGHGPCPMSDSEGRVGRVVGPDANGVRSRCKGTFMFRRAPYGCPGAAPRPRRPPPPSSPRSVQEGLRTPAAGPPPDLRDASRQDPREVDTDLRGRSARRRLEPISTRSAEISRSRAARVRHRNTGALPRRSGAAGALGALPRHRGVLARDGASPGRRPGSARRADPIPEEEVPAVNEMP